MITVDRIKQDDDYTYTLGIDVQASNHINGTYITLTQEEAESLVIKLQQALGLSPRP
jgi:hypothetical protein